MKIYLHNKRRHEPLKTSIDYQSIVFNDRVPTNLKPDTHFQRIKIPIRNFRAAQTDR